MTALVLVVEDDPDVSDGIRHILERDGFAVREAASGEEGVRLALDPASPPAVILLDLMLPGMSGTELCRRLRREPATRRTPVIMLTARTSEADAEEGFAVGADDYVRKPFSARELTARVRALLRRAGGAGAEVYDDGRLRIDYSSMLVSCAGRAVRLTRREFELLSYLARAAGRVAGRGRIIEDVWGHDFVGDSRTLDVHVLRLRRKLGPCGGCFETVVGVGYRFTGCALAAAAAPAGN